MQVSVFSYWTLPSPASSANTHNIRNKITNKRYSLSIAKPYFQKQWTKKIVMGAELSSCCGVATKTNDKLGIAPPEPSKPVIGSSEVRNSLLRMTRQKDYCVSHSARTWHYSEDHFGRFIKAHMRFTLCGGGAIVVHFL
eukprot:Gregarina_sp_Poly_1__2880@NODE_1803_length_3302_cov_190_013910_g689_i1_p3_GENE_NODE_1803_length_3302_cov_190_013910_g689_i1NODE_1803_length_3302_cov_190_013910_g689_i1_p3_ORF_typecomplete_len139_score5_50Endotoxin_mid/PF09131_10/37Endotoxin_mid/PF09131_10/5_8_NODE_1803_length_3302_cov_190_013910_g689_i19371353